MDYLPYLLFGLIGLVGLAILWALAVLIARSAGAIVRVATRRNQSSAKYAKAATKIAYVAFFAFVSHSVYTAVYPTDDFYLGEFYAVTSREPPRHAKVLVKDATYPDFHGDYCSFSRIEVGHASFKQLLAELDADARLTVRAGGQLSDAGFLKAKLPAARVLKSFTRNDTESDHHYTIHFLENGAQVDVHVCVT